MEKNSQHKYCSACNSTKARSEFYPRSKNSDSVLSICKQCKLDKDKERYPRYYKEIRRNVHLLKTYGITESEYDEILKAQNYQCAICETKTPNGRGNFHVDHDHLCCSKGKSCGKCIRGLLCSTCNTRLGDIDWHNRAIGYLNRFTIPVL